MRWYDHGRLFGLMMFFFCILWWIVESPLTKAKQSVTRSCHFSQLSVVKYYTILRYNIRHASTFLSEGLFKGITTYCTGMSTKFNKIGNAVFRHNYNDYQKRCYHVLLQNLGTVLKLLQLDFFWVAGRSSLNNFV